MSLRLCAWIWFFPAPSAFFMRALVLSSSALDVLRLSHRSMMSARTRPRSSRLSTPMMLTCLSTSSANPWMASRRRLAALSITASSVDEKSTSCSASISTAFTRRSWSGENFLSSGERGEWETAAVAAATRGCCEDGDRAGFSSPWSSQNWTRCGGLDAIDGLYTASLVSSSSSAASSLGSSSSQASPPSPPACPSSSALAS